MQGAHDHAKTNIYIYHMGEACLVSRDAQVNEPGQSEGRGRNEDGRWPPGLGCGKQCGYRINSSLNRP